MCSCVWLSDMNGYSSSSPKAAIRLSQTLEFNRHTDNSKEILCASDANNDEY